MSSSFSDSFTTLNAQSLVIPLAHYFVRLTGPATVVSDAATDLYGVCHFTNVPDGVYTVSYSANGSAPWTSTTDTGYKVVSSGGGGGGSIKLQDLGVVNAVDLLAGPQTLYTFGAGEIVLTLLEGPGAELANGASAFVVSCVLSDGSNSGYAVDPLIFQGNYLAPFTGVLALAGGHPSGVIPTQGAAIHAYLGGLVAPWLPNHAYNDWAAVPGAGHIFDSGGGTSGAVEPDWATGVGGSLVDGTITWTDSGDGPTGGSVHLYALIATPV